MKHSCTDTQITVHKYSIQHSHTQETPAPLPTHTHTRKHSSVCISPACNSRGKLYQRSSRDLRSQPSLIPLSSLIGQKGFDLLCAQCVCVCVCRRPNSWDQGLHGIVKPRRSTFNFVTENWGNTPTFSHRKYLISLCFNHFFGLTPLLPFWRWKVNPPVEGSTGKNYSHTDPTPSQAHKSCSLSLLFQEGLMCCFQGRHIMYLLF